MKTVWLRIKIFVKVLQLAKNPERTALVFDIGDALNAIGAFSETLNRINAEPSGAEAMRERRLLGGVDLDKLSLLPEGSLGREFADHMRRLNLDPNFYRAKTVVNDATYMMMRMRQTHDLWHVVTGFKTDVRGEIALQAFMMAYLALPLSLLLVGSALIKGVLLQPAQMGELVDATAKGFKQGKLVQGLFGFDWEAQWHRPLREVRASLGLICEDGG